MHVTFKLYATLMRFLPPSAEGHAVILDVDQNTTIQQVIDSFNISEEQAYLVMLNGVYVAPEQRSEKILHSNDTLALWPKVAGG
jgi:sulfur-carrier protein